MLIPENICSQLNDDLGQIVREGLDKKVKQI